MQKLEWPGGGLKVVIVSQIMLPNKIHAVCTYHRSSADSERNASQLFCCAATFDVGVEIGHDCCLMFPASLMVHLFPRVHTCLGLQSRTLPGRDSVGSVPLLLQLAQKERRRKSQLLVGKSHMKYHRRCYRQTRHFLIRSSILKRLLAIQVP